jgi:hypothetical protein
MGGVRGIFKFSSALTLGRLNCAWRLLGVRGWLNFAWCLLGVMGGACIGGHGRTGHLQPPSPAPPPCPVSCHPPTPQSLQAAFILPASSPDNSPALPSIPQVFDPKGKWTAYPSRSFSKLLHTLSNRITTMESSTPRFAWRLRESHENGLLWSNPRFIVRFISRILRNWMISLLSSRGLDLTAAAS